jgi:hypothetical protein
MNKRLLKRILPLIAVLVLASWPVTQVYAHPSTDGEVNEGTFQEKTIEASAASDTVAVQTIEAPEGVMPSRVFVIENREIVTEETWREMRTAQDAAEKAASGSETTSSAGTIKAKATGMPARFIVVDENDKIVEIWSNTTGMKRGFYSLRVREESLQGSEHPFTQEILAQYNGLLGQVDWTQTDQVYSLALDGQGS